MSNIFSWGEYEENPQNMIGVDTISTQKRATYTDNSNGVFTGDMLESFFTNTDKMTYPQVSTVKGEVPMVLTYGKGFAAPSVKIPTGYDIVTDPAILPEGGTKIAIKDDAVVKAMTTDTVYEDIIITEATVDTNVKFFATENVTMDNITIGGEKGSTNGKITYGAKDVVISNISIEGDSTVYNVFEGVQNTGDNKMPLETMEVKYLDFNNPKLTHNVINVYTPGKGCVITIKDSSFNLTVDNSNVLRLGNYLNSENVTVNFENVEWTYENGVTKNDWNWAGLVIYQPAYNDIALNGDTSKISTWTFNFKNCKYNGKKVTSNNFGEHNQVVYLYNVGNTGAVTDPSSIFTLNFA